MLFCHDLVRRFAHVLLWTSSLLLCCACATRSADPDRLMTIVLQDRNGFSETISQQDRLEKIASKDFLSPQPYQKVIRVFARDSGGTIPSILTTYHSNGQLQHYLEVENGRACGLYRLYFPNGKLKIEARVAGGVADLTEAAIATWQFEGCTSVFYPSGKLRASIPYEGGLIHGQEKHFYENGTRRGFWSKKTHMTGVFSMDLLKFGIAVALVLPTRSGARVSSNRPFMKAWRRPLGSVSLGSETAMGGGPISRTSVWWEPQKFKMASSMGG